MARAVSTDPYMNFRFGLRLTKDSEWLGFSAIGISPNKPGQGPGTLELEKTLGEEFISLLNLGKTGLNIGIWHIAEEFGGKDPDFQIDIHGADFGNATMGQICLDAMSRQKRESRDEKVDPRTRVLLSKLTVPYERLDMYVKETSFKGGQTGQRPVRASHSVIM